MKTMLWIFFVLCASCSFKSEESKKTKELKEISTTLSNDLDSDGDLISDIEEQESGLNPLIANFPKLSVNFLQNYKIKVQYLNQTDFVVDTKKAKDDPDFQYEVGEHFIKDISYNNAARLSRFSDSAVGKLKEHDFTWVKYPSIDEKFYFRMAQDFRSRAKAEIQKSHIELESSIRLLDSPFFGSIEDIELNFYYYSYSQEKYIQLHTEKLEGVFQSGSTEIVKVLISNPPIELIEDTYFRHGEFIISEVKDFFIPRLKIKYSDLMKSIKSRSIPVFKSTPYDDEVNFVAVSSKGENFISILSKLYPEKFVIQENSLTQIEQFYNSLGEYEFLHEVKNEDKAGKWFVMTNDIREKYLKHKFTNKDSISLSYLTGRDLASRVSRKTFTYKQKLRSGNLGRKVSIGNITNNSVLNLSVFVRELEGVGLEVEEQRFQFKPPRCKNCTGNDWSVSADYQINRFYEFSKKWSERDLMGLLSSIEIQLNSTVLSFDELMEKNNMKIELDSQKNPNSIHISISGLDELGLIEVGKDNEAFVKINPLETTQAGEGVQVNKVEGRKVDEVFHAGLICFQEATKRNLPLAVTSWKFNDWQKNVPWGKTDPKTGFIPEKGELRQVWTGSVLDLISTIVIRYN